MPFLSILLDKVFRVVLHDGALHYSFPNVKCRQEVGDDGSDDVMLVKQLVLMDVA